MLNAAVKALSQILSPPMRRVLWRSIGLALVMVTVLAIALQRLLSWLATTALEIANMLSVAVPRDHCDAPVEESVGHRGAHQADA